jgi:ADP-ribose pyrophosphatase YjhB (NUDIX family)
MAVHDPASAPRAPNGLNAVARRGGVRQLRAHARSAARRVVDDTTSEHRTYARRCPYGCVAAGLSNRSVLQDPRAERPARPRRSAPPSRRCAGDILGSMTATIDRFCHACGTAFPSTDAYPRQCVQPECRTVVWANPLPVAVTLVPVVVGDRLGLLVVRRGLEPGRGKLALVGGFIEAHERWQDAAAREVQEEVQVAIDPTTVTLLDAVSSSPRPNRILLFATCPPVDPTTWPPFVPSPEALERGVIFGADDLDHTFAFSAHLTLARRWFAARGTPGPAAYQPL